MGTSTSGGLGSNLAGSTASNPFGMPQSWQAFQSGLQGLGTAIGGLGGGSTGGSNFMRPNATASFSQAQPDTLLNTILQLRQAQAAGLGQPFQSGTAMPRVSLLYG